MTTAQLFYARLKHRDGISPAALLEAIRREQAARAPLHRTDRR